MTFVLIFLWVAGVLALVAHQRLQHHVRAHRDDMASGIRAFHGFEFLHQLLAQKKARQEFLHKLDTVVMTTFAVCLVSIWMIAIYQFFIMPSLGHAVAGLIFGVR